MAILTQNDLNKIIRFVRQKNRGLLHNEGLSKTQLYALIQAIEDAQTEFYNNVPTQSFKEQLGAATGTTTSLAFNQAFFEGWYKWRFDD